MATWVLGYATGDNWSSYEQLDFLIGVDGHGMLGWIDNYCRDNPLSSINLASEQLVIFLKLKRLQ